MTLYTVYERSTNIPIHTWAPENEVHLKYILCRTILSHHCSDPLCKDHMYHMPNETIFNGWRKKWDEEYEIRSGL